MTLDPTTSLFFDASALFAAAHSPQSGSNFIVMVCLRGYLRAVVSPDVLIETERNLLSKSTADSFSRYRSLIASTPLLLISAPAEAVVLQYEPTFVEDAHVVAAALAAQAQYLITLDKELLHRVKQSNLPLIALSPSEFIQTVLVNHPDYKAMRD